MSITTAEYDSIVRKKWPQKVRDEILNRTERKCAYCGCSLDGQMFALDHVVPLRKGGKDEVENLVASCIQCNHYKDTMDVDQFRKNLMAIPERLAERSLAGRIAEKFGMLQKPEYTIFWFEWFLPPWMKRGLNVIDKRDGSIYVVGDFHEDCDSERDREVRNFSKTMKRNSNASVRGRGCTVFYDAPQVWQLLKPYEKGDELIYGKKD